MERTLCIIKPDAVEQKLVGKIIRQLEDENLVPVAMKMVRLDRRQAEAFYDVHKDKSFFRDLTEFMSSGPSVALVLEGECAVERLRKLMGATDPAQAEPGTIRRDFGGSVERNVVHGSDSLPTAAREIAFFF